jgi:hypothetical protein
MKQLKFINIHDGQFTLWDKPQKDTTPFIFSSAPDPNEEIEKAVLEISDAFLLEGELARVAAGLAMSNLGHEVPVDRITQSSEFQDWNETPRLAMENLAGHLCENEEHDEIFVGEAEMWHTDIKGKSVNDILLTYGDRHPWIEQIILSD